MTNQLQKTAGLCLLICLCFFTKHASASFSGILGQSIRYERVSGSKYNIYATVYQDCNSSPTLSSIIINVSDGSTTKAYTGSTCCNTDVTPVADGQCTRCSGSACKFQFGITRYTASVTVDVSVFSGCELTFWWATCCWSSHFANITNTDPNQYIACTLNRCNVDQNSPAFQADPPFWCPIKNATHVYAAATPGNTSDSLVYRLVAPSQGTLGSINYATGYSYLQPIDISGSVNDPKPNGFHYDYQTGELCFTPTTVGYGLMETQVDEYAKDSKGAWQLAGTTAQVFYIFAEDFVTGNHLPVISGTSISTHDSIYTCNGVPLNFTISSKDPDGTDTVMLSVQNETGGDVKISGKKFQALDFSWTPARKDVRNAPYALTITAKDNKIPVPGTAQRKIFVFVKDSLPSTGISIIDSGCGRYHFSLKKPIYKDFKVSWMFDTTHVSDLRDVSYHNTLAGKHIISLIVSNSKVCSVTYTDTVKYDTIYHLQEPETGICLGAQVHLVSAKGSGLLWFPTKGLSDSLAANPVATPKVTTVYTVKGKDATGCTFTDQTRIIVSDYKISTPGNISKCSDKPVKIWLKSLPGAKYSLSPDSSLRTTATADTFLAYPHQSTLYKISANYKGCIKTDSLHVYVKSKTLNIGGDRSYCGKDSLIISSPFVAKTYAWVDDAHSGMTLSTGNALVLKKRGYLGRLYITDTLGCLDTSNEVKVSYVSFLPATSGNTRICYGDSVKLAAFGGNKYSWSLDKAIVSANSNIKVGPLLSTTYGILISDTITGCQSRDSLHVTVAAKPGISAGAVICSGDSVQLSATGGNKYAWSPQTSLQDGSKAQTFASPKATTSYHVTIKDTIIGCTITDSTLVTVNDCVWPGDANKDKTADYLDVLNIGLAYKSTGPARGTTATLWQAYKTADWAKSTGNGINYKHIDCNGDGVVDAKDTSVINANYGKKHTKWTPGTGNLNDPHVYFKFTRDTFYAGDTATAYLYAGDAGHPLVNAYGIGFQTQHVAAPMVNNTAAYAPECGYFCTGSELNYFRPDYSQNTTDATVVETSGNASPNTTGKFARLSFQLKDSTAFSYPTSGQKIYANLRSATVIDKTGKEISVYGINDSAIVLKKKGKNGIVPDNVILHNISVYPNPASTQLVIVTSNIIPVQIVLYNMLGEAVAFVNNTSPDKNIIDVSQAVPGFYLISIKTNMGNAMQKVLITR